MEKPIRSYMYPSDMVEWLFNILVNPKNTMAYNNLGSEEGIFRKFSFINKRYFRNGIDRYFKYE